MESQEDAAAVAVAATATAATPMPVALNDQTGTGISKTVTSTEPQHQDKGTAVPGDDRAVSSAPEPQPPVASDSVMSEAEAVVPQEETNATEEADAQDDAQSDGYRPMSLDVDSQPSDSDSAIGESILSSTTSVRSSLYESVEENGRTYHKFREGKYYLPNDAIEQDRLDLQHHLFLLTLDGKLHLAPVSNPQSVLDIGTGTGIWAMEYALQNPSAQVIGSDLSAIQPQYVPPNCQFEIDDAEDDWLYHQKFDFIHGRAMFTCFKDPAAVFRRAYDALAPGGYFEMQDVYFKPCSLDGTEVGTAVEAWNDKLIEAAGIIGRDWHCTLKYAGYFRDAGFEAVVERQFQWPGNTWPKGQKQKTMGLWMMTNALDGLNAVSMAVMTRGLGMSAQEVELMLVDVRNDIKNKAIHIFWPVYVVYGRKPL